MHYTTFEWTALWIWVAVIAILTYGIVAIHDIPASIARERNHPHADAIEAAGWISLFMLHALWPFLWIWAMYYPKGGPQEAAPAGGLGQLRQEVEQLQERIRILESSGNAEAAPGQDGGRI